MKKGTGIARLTEAQKAEIISLKDICTYKQIAEQFGCTSQTVYNVIRNSKKTIKPSEIASPEGEQQAESDMMKAFEPIYRRIQELVAQKEAINQELKNLRGSMQYAIDLTKGGTHQFGGEKDE